MSRYSLHVNRWSKCRRCDLYKTRHKVVLFRGKIPCDILFVGEAPGESENVIGRPFVGPAGKLLDLIIAKSVPDTISYGITNIVACMPPKEEGNDNRKPDDKCVYACKDRLQELIDMAKPKAIICLGEVSRNYINGGSSNDVEIDKSTTKIVYIRHPAFILRVNPAQKLLLVQKSTIDISKVCDDITSMEETSDKQSKIF